MSGYVNTQILDCSRASSAEGRSNNNVQPAEFTNEVGSGIKLEIGDEISVHSAYVSELGAEAGEIEVKARNIRQTEENKAIMSPELTTYTRPDKARNELLPTKYTYETSVNAAVTPIQGKDQETNIVISPYNTANGEFYAFLPRRWIGAAHETARDSRAWLVADTLDGTLGRGKFTLDSDIQLCPADQRSSWFSQVAPGGAPISINKNDNSRYTIFRQNVAYFNASGPEDENEFNTKYTGLSPSIAALAPVAEVRVSNDKRDPAVIGTWAQVRDLITLSATAGFNSPPDIATEITLQLNKRDDPVDLYYGTEEYAKPGVTPPVATFPNQQQIKLFSYTESPTYKVYNAASHDSAGKDGFTFFRNSKDSVTDLELNRSHAYMSSYQHLGVKRPKFFTQGRKTNGTGGSLIPGDSARGNTPYIFSVLNLGLPWTEANLQPITDLLTVQGQYPDLFKDKFQHDTVKLAAFDNPVTPETTRFLHFNTEDEDVHVPAGLGYDLYGDEASAAYSAKSATSPLFFDFNPDTVNVKASDVGYAIHNGPPVSDYLDLAHGWARRVRSVDAVTGVTAYFVGIQFSQVGDRMPDWMGAVIAKIGSGGRRFGFDYHFSAYGNPVMMLTTGQLDERGTTGRASSFIATFHANDIEKTGYKINVAHYNRRIYLGADGPLMGFNPNTSRFELSNLHVAEREGNLGDAGAIGYNTVPAPGTAVPGVDLNTDAGQKCYKVNKRFLSNNYCVNVTPYSDDLSAPGGFPYPKSTIFSQQMEAWQVYDAQCGIFIEEFVVPQFNWNTNLIGVMGFRYDQVNPGSTDRQTRVQDYKTAGDMLVPTTNAKINEADIIEYSRNGFNSNVYNQDLASVVARTSGGASNGFNQYPAITFPNVSSTVISAQELPTKSLKPYYTIRSDLVQAANWIAGSNSESAGPSSRAVVAIVDKVNGYADFYTQESSQLLFTNTVPRVITSIRTSIHDPDGTFADVDLNSSVIYMIKHKIQTDLTPVQTLLESKKKSDQVAAAAAEQFRKPSALDPDKTSYSQVFE